MVVGVRGWWEGLVAAHAWTVRGPVAVADLEVPLTRRSVAENALASRRR